MTLNFSTFSEKDVRSASSERIFGTAFRHAQNLGSKAYGSARNIPEKLAVEVFATMKLARLNRSLLVNYEELRGGWPAICIKSCRWRYL